MSNLLELWLVKLILLVRPDLAALADHDGARPLAWWLLTSGQDEYAAVRENTELRRFLNEVPAGARVTRLQALVYLRREDVRKAYALDSQEFRQWFDTHGVAEHRLSAFVAAETASHTPTDSRPFGVNVIGHAFGELGVGEEARMAARALDNAGVPFAVMNVPAGSIDADRSIEQWVHEEGPYAFNLFCMTPMETVRRFLQCGPSQWSGRFNIGQWWWELAKWPRAWLPAFRLVDEIWAPTRHIFDGVRQIAPVHCEFMPSAVELGAINGKTRADFGLPRDSYLFCCSFDLNSSVIRKNPAAVVESFLRAFPKRASIAPRVGLVLKCQQPVRAEAAWEAVKAASLEDERVHIIEATLPRADLLALYRACDCYVSLHRSEGFGRNIAESLALGLDVIATDYGGNTDLRSQLHLHPVKWTEVPVGAGEYPWSEGAIWAEPDTAHAATLMRNAAQAGRHAASISDVGTLEGHELARVACRYCERLDALKSGPDQRGSW